MIQYPLSPERVRALTARYRTTPKPPANSGRRAYVLTPEAIARAEHIVYTEGRSFKEAALAVGCSLSRLYTVLPAKHRANGGAA